MSVPVADALGKHGGLEVTGFTTQIVWRNHCPLLKIHEVGSLGEITWPVTGAHVCVVLRENLVPRSLQNVRG